MLTFQHRWPRSAAKTAPSRSLESMSLLLLQPQLPESDELDQEAFWCQLLRDLPPAMRYLHLEASERATKFFMSLKLLHSVVLGSIKNLTSFCLLVGLHK